MKTKFTGVMPALITCMDENGNLNRPVLEKLLGDLLAQGADGFYVCGATGEGLTISKKLHMDMTRETVKIVAGRVPCIVHVARMNMDEMLELAAYAESVGADAISAVPPLFYKYDNDGIYAYYKRLCDSVKIPVVIYNNPNTGVSFGIDLLERLFTIPNLTSIKWTNSDFFTVLRLKERVPEANVINGPDEMLAMGLAAGCDACIGTTYNFQLPLIKAIYNAFKENRVDEARELQMKADKIIGALLSRNTIMATKLLMDRMGYDVYHAVFPMQKFSPEVEELQLKELREAGFEF